MLISGMIESVLGLVLVLVRVRVGWGTSVLRASGSKKSLSVCFNFS